MTNITQDLIRSRISIATIFLFHGFIAGSWITRIPEIKSRLGLSESQLGYLLFAAALGIIVSITLAGGLISKYHAKIIIPLGTYAGLIFLNILPLSKKFTVIWISLFLFGVTFVLANASANAQAAKIEKAYNKSIMVSFHATFSIGGFLGAMFGGWTLKIGLSMMLHFLIFSIAILILVTLAQIYFYEEVSQEENIDDLKEKSRDKQSILSLPPKALIPLGLIAFVSSIGEGIAADWSSLLLLEKLSIQPYQAAWGFAAFTSFMTIGRLIGDKLTSLFDKNQVLMANGVFGATGFLIVVFSSSLNVTLIGFAIAGLGLSTVFPLCFSLAANKDGFDPETAVASVSSIGYLGYLLGPVVIGIIAEKLSINTAFFFASLSIFLIPILVKYGQDTEIQPIRDKAPTTQIKAIQS